MARIRGDSPASQRLILDSGAVLALARGDARARAFLARALELQAQVEIPVAVLAEMVRGGPRDAPVNRVVKAVGTVAEAREIHGRVAGDDARRARRLHGLSGSGAQSGRNGGGRSQRIARVAKPTRALVLKIRKTELADSMCIGRSGRAIGRSPSEVLTYRGLLSGARKAPNRPRHTHFRWWNAPDRPGWALHCRGWDLLYSGVELYCRG